MKKLLLLGLAALLTVFCGCGDSEAPKKPAESDDRQTFTVGFDAEFPPFAYRENDDFAGFDLDLAREVAKRNNWRLVLKPINWEAKDEELSSGKLDCIWCGFTIDGRENDYEWTLSYCAGKQVLMVRQDSKIKNFGDIANKTVATQSGTSILQALSPGGKMAIFAQNFREIVKFSDFRTAIRELEAGKVDLVALDLGVAKKFLSDGKFRLLEPELFAEKYGVGFRKGNTALRNAVQKTLVEMVDDGTAARISAKYFDGEDVLTIGKPPKF